MADLKMRTKVLLRSRSLAFTRDYFDGGQNGARTVYDWNGVPVHYRRGSSDTRLIYSILLKRGKKGEYFLPLEWGIRAEEVRTVLDIGANAGISAVYFAASFPQAEVHAFEPDPGNCELLRLNAQACGRIHVHAFALGPRDGELTLYDSDEAINFGGFSAHAAGVNPARSKKVPMRHAGRCLAELGIRSIDLLKIDTEGAEWDILTAVDPALLGQTRAIMGELHGMRDFALLDYLQPMFDIGMKKQIRNRLFNFYALRRNSE
jgi:FkbM family methyltransferase